MIERLHILAILLATLALFLAYALGGWWSLALLFAVLGALWGLGQWRGWTWVANMGLLLFVGGAAFGVWLGMGAVWMLVGVVAALSAWDLEHFARRLGAAGRIDRAWDLQRNHLLRLLMVDALGLVLGGVALSVRIPLGFGAAVLLAALAVFAMTRAIRFFRHQVE